MTRTLAACLMVVLASLAYGQPTSNSATRATTRAEASHSWEAIGEGTITDSTHPNRPGDFRTYNVRVRVALEEQTGEGEITISNKERADSPPDRYFWRRGRVFQSNDAGDDLPPQSMGDLSPATLAMVHPGLLAAYWRERPENFNAEVTGPRNDIKTTHYLIASNDVLWRAWSGQNYLQGPHEITCLWRRFHHDVMGSTYENIDYDGSTVLVRRAGAIVSKLTFADPKPIERIRTPQGDPKRDAAMVIPPEEFVFRDLGGGLFACELARANARVFVIEFEDHLLVFEGVYTTRNAETLAAAVRERFKKPVTFFAFSHIHGQYVGGVRVWAHEGATILVPPTSAPLISEVLSAPFDLRPDAWSLASKAPNMEPVAERWSHEDASASVVIINDKESDHTDEYFVVYLPRTKTILTGDLLFYRPGKALTGRSLTLAGYIEKKGLAVDRCITTWPLEWPGVKNEVTGEELRAAAKAK